MKMTMMKKGFTLIELLVVITIIGILATGWVTIYTAQIQKARDTTRIKDVASLNTAIEQAYQENQEYPYATAFFSWSTGVTGVATYMGKIPADSKHGKTCNNAWGGTDCGYSYRVAPDTNGIDFWAFEVSTAFESEGNVEKKARLDDGNDTSRYEQGVQTSSLDSSVATDAITPRAWACTAAGAAPSTDTEVIIINGIWNCS